MRKHSAPHKEFSDVFIKSKLSNNKRKEAIVRIKDFPGVSVQQKPNASTGIIYIVLSHKHSVTTKTIYSQDPAARNFILTCAQKLGEHRRVENI